MFCQRLFFDDMRAKKIKRGRGVCAICGVAEATTDDHLPPQNLFPKPKPSDLITVPACSKCNNGSSKHDEEFRVFLSLQLGMETNATEQLWKKGALRTLDHNNRLRNLLIKNSWDVEVRTPSGLFVETKRAVAVPMRGHNAVCDRIARGLYYHHFGVILGRRVRCRVVALTSVPDHLDPIVSQMAFASVADGAFAYRYARANESPLDSMWLLMFYERHLVFVETRSKRRKLLGRALGQV